MGTVDVYPSSHPGLLVVIRILPSVLIWPVSFAQSLVNLAKTPRLDCFRVARLAPVPNGDGHYAHVELVVNKRKWWQDARKAFRIIVTLIFC